MSDPKYKMHIFFYFKGNVQFSWNILVGRALPFFKNGDRTNHDRSMTEVSREQRVEGKKNRRRGRGGGGDEEDGEGVMQEEEGREREERWCPLQVSTHLSERGSVTGSLRHRVLQIYFVSCIISRLPRNSQ